MAAPRGPRRHQPDPAQRGRHHRLRGDPTGLQARRRIVLSVSPACRGTPEEPLCGNRIGVRVGSHPLQLLGFRFV
ncbi:hypothetical protein BN12_970008 [Nostocoides japonicum T1-X7]|uniref:Uncharacterized protein n=1 Tax=Nostocoides japonicum T1-X7 TaxID=1194083 RepID=A0A077M620_9MICO|nr:hypothetical protein BN12_970008 [Tetrasphaera japonica T1-X7]